MDVRLKLGRRVQALRRDKGLSQEAFADAVGLHRTYISGVERGVRNPTLTVMNRIAAGLGLPLCDLVRFD